MIKAKLAAFVSRILSGILIELKKLEVKHLNPKFQVRSKNQKHRAKTFKIAVFDPIRTSTWHE